MCGCHMHAHTPQLNGFLKENKKDLISIDVSFCLIFKGKVTMVIQRGMSILFKST